MSTGTVLRLTKIHFGRKLTTPCFWSIGNPGIYLFFKKMFSLCEINFCQLWMLIITLGLSFILNKYYSLQSLSLPANKSCGFPLVSFHTYLGISILDFWFDVSLASYLLDQLIYYFSLLIKLKYRSHFPCPLADWIDRVPQKWKFLDCTDLRNTLFLFYYWAWNRSLNICTLLCHGLLPF